LLEGFSKKDIRAITYLACQQLKKPKYKIILQEFSDACNKMKFKIKNKDQIIIKSASQIILDKSIIKNMSKDDISSVSYIAGYEHSQERTS